VTLHELTIRDILQKVKEGAIDLQQAEEMMKSYEDHGFFKLDTHREKRQGFPEIIYGEGKTSEQIIEIVRVMIEKNQRTLVTRVSEEKGKVIKEALPETSYNEIARTICWLNPNEERFLYNGYTNVVSAGTSDLPIAMEAATTLEVMGCRVELITDVGVAGIHRLFDKLPKIRSGLVTVVVAGMEGALPSVIGGLVSHPIIAVPTSVGYGTNFNGLAALLSMLNACSSGISVVNIDNGFGAGYNAALIHKLAQGEKVKLLS